jgi:hypothetical protein
VSKLVVESLAVRERGVQLVLIVVMLALASGCRSNHAPHSSKVFEHLSLGDRIELSNDRDWAPQHGLLRPVRNIAGRFGGSHAQRDLLDLTLIEAAFRSG